ncbi:MAG: DUF2142 domain-containing protein [Elusimicrobia bacterium]|nr:DUF2142 domain-containing protein [Candidatus Obscuribacterium magneticum]
MGSFAFKVLRSRSLLERFPQKPEKIFLLVSLLFGIPLCFITPPFQVPDEVNHFFRAYQISQGQLITVREGDQLGGWIPKSLFDTASATTEGFSIMFHPERKINLNRIFSSFSQPQQEEKKFLNFPNTALYTPVPYIPQVIGIAIGNWLKSPPLLFFYFGRLTNLLASVSITFLAIATAPFYQWFFFLYALTPMTVFLRSSLSADPFTNAISLLFIAVTLKLAFVRRGFIPNKLLLAYFSLALLVALSKQAYILLLLLYFLIPLTNIGSPKRYWSAFSVGSSCCLVVWLIATTLVTNKYNMPSTFGAYLSNQTNLLLSHPAHFFTVALKTAVSDKLRYIKEFLGQLGWLDTSLSTPFLILLGMALVISALSDGNERIEIKMGHRMIIFSAILSSTLLIFVSLYISGTQNKDNYIHLQGRYFIPIGSLPFLLLYNRKLAFLHRKGGAQILLFTWSLVSLVYTTLVIIKRYYY